MKKIEYDEMHYNEITATTELYFMIQKDLYNGKYPESIGGELRIEFPVEFPKSTYAISEYSPTRYDKNENCYVDYNWTEIILSNSQTNKLIQMGLETEFDKWCKTLTAKTMSLNKKIKELNKNRNNIKTFSIKKSSQKNIFNKIEEYVKNHANEYKTFIMKETLLLYKQGKIKRPYEWSYGLYNCDELYLKAIKNCAFH